MERRIRFMSHPTGSQSRAVTTAHADDRAQINSIKQEETTNGQKKKKAEKPIWQPKSKRTRT